MAITSKEINLGQLDVELGSKGLVADFNDPKKKIILTADDSDVTEAQLKAAIEAHVAVDDVAVKAQAKSELLTRLGITEEEAKLLLS
jgi:uncharacterized LabA/DUF88 family protein